MSDVPFELGEPGVPKIWVDDFELPFFPDRLSPQHTIYQYPFKAADGSTVLYKPYGTAGNPDQAIDFSWLLPFSWIPEEHQATREKLEEILSEGGLHTLCLWKPMLLTYTAALGQDTFYIPRRRQNAATVFSLDEYGDYLMTFTVNGVARDLAFEDVVDDSTVVADGDVSVSRTLDTRGRLMVKTSPSIGPGDIPAGKVGAKVQLLFYPVHTVFISEITSDVPEAGKEPKAFTFMEA